MAKKQEEDGRGLVNALAARPFGLVSVLFVFGGVVTVAVVDRQANEIGESTALVEAHEIARSVVAFRRLYTEKVVGTAVSNGLDARADYEGVDHAIPLPATLTVELGEMLSESTGARFRLYSDYPFPTQEEAGGLRDDFDREAWRRLTRDPDEPVYAFVELEGEPMLRYAVADILTADCVECHNTHPDTPKNDWEVGDVRGVLEVDVPMKDAAAQSAAALRETSLLLGFLGFLGILGLGLIFNLQRRGRRRLEGLVEEGTHALSRTEANLKGVVDAAADGIVTIDTDAIIQSINPAVERTFGYSPEEVVGKNVKILMPSPYADEHDEYVGRYLRTGEAQIIGSGREVRGRRKDGTTFPLYLAVGEIQGDGSRGFVGILRDVTEQHEAAKELRNAKEAAEAATKAKSEFLANMSHEIRTPMNAVIGMTGLMIDGELSDAQRRRAQVVRRSADALLNVINEILDYSKIEAGKLMIELIPCDLHRTLEDAMQTLAPIAAEKNLELILRLSPALPRGVVMDPGRVRQVLMNLVGNAIKFTREGYVTVDVTDAKLDEGGEIRIAVTDTGVGIPPDRLGSIFDAFTQADASITRNFGGTGLGLSITKHIVELMGGTIGVESTVGEGSHFTINLPVELSAIIADSESTVDLEGVAALVVDDIEVNRQLLTERLEQWGVTVDSYPDAQSALEGFRLATAEGKVYAFGIIDYQMPGMSGIELGVAIRREPSGTALRLIMFSSSDIPRDADYAAADFSAHLVKPLVTSELRRMLKGALLPSSSTRIFSDTLEESRAALKRVEGVRALLVDDVDANRQVGREMLESMGCRVDLAANGQEALQMQADVGYDIIFMDCQMPVMDGYTATRALRERETDVRVPVIAMTAAAMEGDRQRCIDAGMNGYLSKPVDISALNATLLEHVGEVGRVKSGEDDDRAQDRMRAKFTAMFVKGSREQLEHLQRAVAEADADAVMRRAHSLRGSCGTLATPEILSLATSIELLGEQGKLEEVAEPLAELARLLRIAWASGESRPD